MQVKSAAPLVMSIWALLVLAVFGAQVSSSNYLAADNDSSICISV